MKKTLPLLCALLLAGALSGPAARAADYTNSIGMAFKDIPAGRFYMGSCKQGTTCPSGAGMDDEAYDPETPQHEVHIRRGFRMGVYEVTVGQFKQYIADAGRDDLLSDNFIEFNSIGDRAPVVEVSWHDAQDFIGWLNKKEGTRAYRLPSEAEWEYAARAGTTTRYSWGDAIGRNRANCDGCGSVWDGKRHAPVGSFAPNGFGLYDMHGNVWEWVEDCWHENYYEGAPTDGSAWTSGCGSSDVIIRGGSWSIPPEFLRAALRYWVPPSIRDVNSGFRLVQDLKGALSGPAARAADYTNSIGMEFNNIPAGRFYMGSCKLSEAEKEADKKQKFMGLLEKFMGLLAKDATCPSGAGVDDQAYDNETPQHEVHIRRGFRMGVHEVTLGQFKQYIADAGRDDLLSDDFIQYNRSGDRAAVSYVSRNDAQGFIDWLNKKEGTQAYRLPSESEWEYAARAGTTTRYSWGNAIGRNRANCNGCGSRWDVKRPAPVGSFAPNAFGLYDMHGNVYEWVADCWHDSYKGAPTDGRAWAARCDEDSAVVRGGAWRIAPPYQRAAYRDWYGPADRVNTLGFRLVQDLNP